MPLTAKPLSTSPSLKSPSSPSKLKQSEAKPKPKPVSRRRCFTYSFFKSKLTQGYHRALSPHHLHHLDGQAGGTDRHITQPSWQRQRVCRVIHAAFSLSLSSGLAWLGLVLAGFCFCCFSSRSAIHKLWKISQRLSGLVSPLGAFAIEPCQQSAASSPSRVQFDKNEVLRHIAHRCSGYCRHWPGN